MKKLSALICAFVIILSICGNLAASAASTDLLGGYGSFESGTAGWSGSFGTNASIDNTTVHSGSKALKITNDSSTNAPWVSTTYSGLAAGATYTVEGYINGYFTGSSGAGFKTEYYNDAGDAYGGNTSTYTNSTNGLWIKLTHTFVAPAGASRVKVYCRLYTTGTVYFDDVKLYFTGEPTKFEFSAKDIFHYTDDTTGTASAILNSYYNLSSVTNTSVKFTIISDSTSEVIDSNILAFNSQTITYNYNPGNLSKNTKYTLNIRVYNTGTNETYDSYSQSLYIYDRPSMLGADGFVRYNGEIFNPVIAYHVSNTADYKYMKDLGVNVVQVPYWYTSPGEATQREALLSELDKNGLKALFCLYRNMLLPNDPANISHTKYVVDQLKNDPRVFAFAIMDEPLGAGVTDVKLQNLEQSYKIIRDIDKMHPIYTVDFTPAYFEHDLKFCDIFAVDPYNYSLTGVRGLTQQAVALANNRKPVYTIVGTFKTSTGSFPTADMVRHMTYQSLLYGAKGFGYFSFEDSIPANLSGTGKNIPLYQTDLWDGMCNYASTDMGWAFKALVNNKAQSYISNDIGAKQWTENGENYYFVMSMKSTSVTQTFYTRGTDLQIVYGTSSGNVTAAYDATYLCNKITVTVPSGAIILLKDKAVNGGSNLIANGDFEGINGSLYSDTSNSSIAYWSQPASCLVTDSTGNHYFKNKTGSGTSLNFLKLPEIGYANVYKLSFKYKHPQGTNMFIRFNAGNSTYDYSINTLKDAGADVWRTHTMYLKMPLWATGNFVRIGGYTGSYLTGEWCIDDIKLTPADDEFAFSKVATGASEVWSTAINNGNKGVLSNNTLYYKTEVYENIDSLSKAQVDGQGNRLLYSSVHSAAESGKNLRMITAVYEIEGECKTLIDINVKRTVTTDDSTTYVLPAVTIPPAQNNKKYEVKFLLWNSVNITKPLSAGTSISD